MKRMLAVLTLGLAGCAGAGVDHYRAEQPALDLKTYLNGTLDAWGMFQGRSGEVKKRFHVVIDARWQGDTGVLDEHFAFLNRCGDVSLLPTPVYFYGIEMGQEVWVEIEPGKTLVISLEALSEPDEEGIVTVYFKLNGQNRQVAIQDRSLVKETEQRRRADPAAPGEVGAPMPGRVIALQVREGAKVAEGEPLLTLEAMKMETVVRAPVAGTVRELCTDVKAMVKAQDLLVVLDPAK